MSKPLPNQGDLILRHATLDNGEEEFDELVATNASVHLEVMSDNHWWMSVTVGDREVHVNFGVPEGQKIAGWAEEQ